MRCKSCDYPLWHITGRQCPECGRPFVPSEFEFVINSVRFCCPHCEQPYYGTGDKGHLVPRTFACVNCEKFIDMDQMVLLPAEGVAETQTETDHNPWLWQRTGKVRSWFATVGKAMVNPGRLIAATPGDAPVGRAFSFALITMLIVAFVGSIPTFGFMLLGLSMGGPMGSGPGPGPVMLALTQVAASFGMSLGWAIGILLILTVCAHGLLRLTGKCDYGIGRTFQVMCYSSGANLLSAVPCVGSLGSIWWIVSAILMLKEGQRVSGGRATLAVLTVPALLILAAIGLIAWAIAGFTLPTPGGSGWTSQYQVEAVTTAIVDNHAAPGTPPLKHVAELMASDVLSPDEFLTEEDAPLGGSNRLARLRVGGRSLAQWDTDQRKVKDIAAAQAAAELPADVVAYRVGDMVFTHSGIDLTDPKMQSSGLWIVVAWPESWTGAGGSQNVEIGLADGTTRTVVASAMQGELQTQNLLRKSLGLAPLPEPRLVKHGAPHGPAVGEGGSQTPPPDPASIPDDADEPMPDRP